MNNDLNITFHVDLMKVEYGVYSLLAISLIFRMNIHMYSSSFSKKGRKHESYF